MGNPIWFVFWFLVFWFISFIVAFFSAFLYIIVYTLEVIFSGLSGLNGLLLQGIQFPHFCFQAMLDFKSPYTMKNPIWFIFWLLVLIFISFFIAGICTIYIWTYMFEVCCNCCAPLNNLLMKGIQFPHYCAEAMLQCRSPC